MKWFFQVLGFIFFTSAVWGQDTISRPEKLNISGYIKDLQTLTFDSHFKELNTGNLIHNRLNFKWMPSEKFTASAELRNRLFWGELVKYTPDFASQLRNNNEKLNMQKSWTINRSMVFHTNAERLNLDYHDEALNIRVGRQRINWGLTTTWNPNDIFNAYNFLDFDYEERPGIDGAKVHYILNSSAGIEFAYANTGNKNGNIAAFKYSVNKWNYDMQFISGWYKDQLTLGTGWAGYIRDAGFKGEVQYFTGTENSKAHLNLSLEGDYMFDNGWYVSSGVLFNNYGLSKPVDDWNLIDLRLSPDNMMPTRWNAILTTAKELNPLLTANMSVLYAPGTNLLILFPSVQYNMAPDLDLNLVWQSFFAELDDNFKAVNHQGILRLKWNF